MSNHIEWKTDLCKRCSGKVVKLVLTSSACILATSTTKISVFAPWTDPSTTPSFRDKKRLTFCHAICQFDGIGLRHDLGVGISEIYVFFASNCLGIT